MGAKRSLHDNVEVFAPRVRLPELRRVRCAFRSGDTTFFPRLEDVIWIQARRNYSEVFMTTGNFTVREVLVSLERRLAPHGFLRVQRSTIVNLDHVVEIRRVGRGRYAVMLSNGSTVDVAAAIRDKIEQLLTIE